MVDEHIEEEKGFGFGADAYDQEQIKREVNDMDNDVVRLADNVSNLHKMFKQMHEMIFEQGTIVDRIDYQIEQGATKVKQGTKKLVKVLFSLMSFKKQIRLKSIRILCVPQE